MRTKAFIKTISTKTNWDDGDIDQLLSRATIDLYPIAPDILAMVVVRTILAALIAISLALLPASAGAAVSTKPIEMSMSHQADMPCCPPDDCKDSIVCGLKCFNFAGALPVAMAVMLPRLATEAPPSFVHHALHAHVRSPPTHPPPV